ncbi:alkene reductase [Lichenihabitans sp. Uapishka_5]|uniref:alkene reductase n=1 Tax=Lichenihabitans sp. Uapishka_5 TaxID=3037302 RepID=UPI0029E829B6|nr:alkene reductase [Lichenihabitans sp. Uapishka_5]MDX7950272.1 alkene reductase [Lichenihabitans sp. Uapishka_5]
MPGLFDPLKVGALMLPNRIIMAPLTRARATDERVPTPLMVDYYVQRASAGLIVTEATSVTPMGVGYANTPGIWSDEQVAGWRVITDAVHTAGGRMVMQLWHVGRISDPSLLGGMPPVAPSAIAAAGHVSLLRPERPYPTPRALDIGEIPGIVEAYRVGAANAKKAGFDGVELHGANGYLLDQFLQDKTNKRQDAYGGSIENRARLMLETIDAAIDVWGADRVGLHLAPRGDAHDMGDSDAASTFFYVARECGKRGLAFLFAREHVEADRLAPSLKKQFGGVFITNERFTLEQSQQDLDSGAADAIAFGVRFIANPDLPARLQTDGPYNELDRSTMYARGAEGYTDYPALAG